MRDRTRHEDRPEDRGARYPADLRPSQGGGIRLSPPPEPPELPAYSLPDRGPEADGAGNVVPLRRPGGRSLPSAAERTGALAALSAVSRASLHYLRLVTGFPEEVLVDCVNLLARDGLVAAEERGDGNESRRMVEITPSGRTRVREALLAGGAGADGTGAGA